MSKYPDKEAILAAVDAIAGRSTGAGADAAAAVSGCSCCGSMRDDDGSVQWMLHKNPQLAIARALGLEMVPDPFAISIGPLPAGAVDLPDQGCGKDEDEDLPRLIYGIRIDIQDPNAFPGDILKPQRDAYFAETSGLMVSLDISGRRNWDTNYVSLAALRDMVSRIRPWVLCPQQAITVDLKTTTPMPYAGATVIINFLSETPGCEGWRMDDAGCFCALEKMGYGCDAARKLAGL